MNPETASFSASVVHLDGNAIVVLVGELDMEWASNLSTVLDDLTVSGPREIALDLSSLDFIDSSGIAVVIAAQGRLRAQGRQLSLRSPKPLVARVLAITHLTEYLSVEASEPVEMTPWRRSVT